MTLAVNDRQSASDLVSICDFFLINAKRKGRGQNRTDYGVPPKASKQIPRRVWALRAAPWNKGADVVVTGGLADTRSYVDEV